MFIFDNYTKKCYYNFVGGFMTTEEFLKELKENDKLVAMDKSTDIENMKDFVEFIESAKVRKKKEEKDER